MKNTLAALLLFTVPVLADVEIDRTEAANMKSYTINEFAPKSTSLDGKLIKLKFSSRAARIDKEDGLSSAIICNETNSKKKGIDPYSSTMRIYIPDEGLPWFNKVTVNDWESKSSYVAICRVEKDKVTMLGREIKTDIRGSRIVW